MSRDESHEALAERLRSRVAETGVLAPELRDGAVAVGGGAAAELQEPFVTLVRQIADASYRVTDEHVDAVRSVAGSDQAAFEVVMAASVGAGLRRWDAAIRAIEGATDASSRG